MSNKIKALLIVIGYFTFLGVVFYVTIQYPVMLAVFGVGGLVISGYFIFRNILEALER